VSSSITPILSQFRRQQKIASLFQYNPSPEPVQTTSKSAGLFQYNPFPEPVQTTAKCAGLFQYNPSPEASFLCAEIDEDGDKQNNISVQF
jgi:hypothetical protein